MSFGLYAAAALAEIAGCFAFWAWWKQGASIWWLVPGMASLAVFAWVLALTPADAAGRSYAAYGGGRIPPPPILPCGGRGEGRPGRSPR